MEIGGAFYLGEISLGDGYQINLTANGKVDGITNTGTSLWVYGTMRKAGQTVNYSYSIDTDSVTVDADNNVTLTFISTQLKTEEKIEINFM